MPKKNDKNQQKISKAERERIKKEVLKEELNKVEAAAQKIALKTMTEMQLADQIELSEDQKRGASFYAQGYTDDEVAEMLGKPRQEIVHWKKFPTFMRLVNELTIKEGLSDKNERIKSAKRITQEIQDTILKKIADGQLDNMSITLLNNMLMQWSNRLDTLVDKNDEKNAGNRDVSVLILGHIQQQNSKKYDKLEDFLTDESFKFPTIDVEPTDEP